MALKFTHLGDCHLGGWKQPALRLLNFQSFQRAIDKSISEKVDFVIITGDLFDAAYPSIETLKEAFHEFKRLYIERIPVFLIAGSHDYSASGKTFLDVLEKAGFCRNVAISEERNDSLMLHPTLYKNVALYGYPGKKTGLEVDDIQRIKLHDAPGMFKILLLHTAIKDAVGNLPIKAVDHEKLPKVDYLALSHLHVLYNRQNRVYSGPTFPNSLLELEELRAGYFCIFENGKIRREEIKIKEVLSVNCVIDDAREAASKIVSSLDKEHLRDKILILKLSGIIQKGKISDIDFKIIDEYVRKREVFAFIK
ncbi:DNA repair exonuclease, partial [Candidatus Pacearchaeota archaeon]|nr:DNA repair exonuclease [Candidatus Pacearchaeota archaeon]